MKKKSIVILWALVVLCFMIYFVQSSISWANDIVVNVTTNTQKKGTVITESYTRNGMTNLVRRTYRKDDAVQLVQQQIYYNDDLVCELTQMDDGLTCSSKPAPEVCVGTHYTVNGDLDTVNLMLDKALICVDHFTVTNTMLYPISNADLEKANAIGEDTKQLFNPDNVKNCTNEEFIDQVDELIKKHE